MTETLSQWEKQRVQVVRDIAGLGDFRRGSITGIIGRCGKSQLRLPSARASRARTEFSPDP